MENQTQSARTENSSLYSAIAFTLVTVSIVIFLENIVTILSVLCYGRRRNSPDIWICSLSLADILHSCVPTAIIFYVYMSDFKAFSISSKLCKAQGWFLVMLRLSSCTTVAVMSCSQFLRNFRVVEVRDHWKHSNQVICIIFIWILSAFVASLPLTGMGEISQLKDTENVYCQAKSNTAFGIVFFCLILFMMILAFCAVLGSLRSLQFFSGNRSRSFDSVSDLKRTGYGKRKLKLIQELQNRALTNMVTVVCSIFCICLLPRMILLFLGLISVHTSSIYSLLSLQLPLVSSLINPLVYAIMWEPYRRGYIRLLTCSGCTNCRLTRRQSHSGSHTLNGSSLMRQRSFWSAEFQNEDEPRVLDELFGPNSVFKPLDFNNDELQLFDTSQSTIAVDESVHSSPKTLQDEIELESSIQFQSILDLIDQMVNRGGKATEDEKDSKYLNKDDSDSINGIDFRPMEKRSSSSLSGNTCTTLDDPQDDARMMPQPWMMPVSSTVQQCCEHPRGSVTSSTAGCSCLGRGKSYDLQNPNRYLDYLVSKEVKEGVNVNEKVIVIEV